MGFSFSKVAEKNNKKKTDHLEHNAAADINTHIDLTISTVPYRLINKQQYRVLLKKYNFLNKLYLVE